MDKPQAVKTIAIKWDPDHGAFNLQWPQNDAITALGMLETAKGKILAQILGQAEHHANKIIPVAGYIKPHAPS